MSLDDILAAAIRPSVTGAPAAAASARIDRDAIAAALNQPSSPPVHYVHPADLDAWNHYYATGVWDASLVRRFNPDTRSWERP